MLKRIFRSFLITISMYTRIPMPHLAWEEEDMRYTALFLPVPGILLGAAETAVCCLCRRFEISETAVFLLPAVSILFTGGLHLDGYMDTSDALNFFGDREKRLAIMKDPHTGAFAVIRLLCMVLFGMAAVSVWIVRAEGNDLLEFAAVFVISRLLASFGMAFLKGARKEGLLFTFASAADRKTVRIVLTVSAALTGGLMILFFGLSSLLLILANSALFFLYRRIMYAGFGGITGDTEGWLICESELVGTAVLALCLLAGI